MAAFKSAAGHEHSREGVSETQGPGSSGFQDSLEENKGVFLHFGPQQTLKVHEEPS